MSAYLIVNVDVKDFEKIKKYISDTPAVVEKYSGKFLARGGELLVVEGNWNPKRVVIIEFDSFEKAKEYYNSDDYKPLKLLRQSSAETDVVIVDGLAN